MTTTAKSPHENGTSPKQSCLHGHLRCIQARVPEHHQQAQSLCALSQATHQRFTHRLRSASVVEGGCVTSVNIQNVNGQSFQPILNGRCTFRGCHSYEMDGFARSVSVTMTAKRSYFTHSLFSVATAHKFQLTNHPRVSC